MILDKIFDFFLINNFSLSTVESVTGGKLSSTIIKKGFLIGKTRNFRIQREGNRIIT